MALTCNRAEFITNGACFTQQRYSAHEQQAIIVYRWAQIVDGIAGVANYSNSPFTELLNDSNSATCGLSEDQMVAGYIGVLNTTFPTGVASSFATETPALTQAEVVAALACMSRFSDVQLARMRLYLTCYFFAVMGY